MGAAAVVDTNNVLLGIITDGDLRRMLEKNTNFSTLSAQDIMTKNPKTISPQDMAIAAFERMEQNSITQLAVVEKDIYKGMLHLHDLLKEGIV
jgi:arabinose-5-phosphate isomerase